jgi:hypothetical protein
VRIRSESIPTFGCTCYPNLTATTPHKLAPCSSLCAFLSYSPDHKGYRCLDLSTNRVIISRHVVFDETTFPFSSTQASPPSQNLDFLTDDAPVQVFFPLHVPPALLGCIPRQLSAHPRAFPRLGPSLAQVAGPFSPPGTGGTPPPHPLHFPLSSPAAATTSPP